MAGASFRIPTFYLALVILAGSFSVRAEDSVEGLTPLDEAPNAPSEVAPVEPAVPVAPVQTVQMAPPAPPPGTEIEAIAYDLTTIRPSKSGRVYLFQAATADLAPNGKIFLLREGTTPVMAFRVLRVYPAQKRIAAKKLRAYPGYDPLGRGSKFRAFEKISDRVQVIPPSPEDLSDLKELEAPAELPPPPVDQLPPEVPVEEIAPQTVAPETVAPPLPAEEPIEAPPVENLDPAPPSEPLPATEPAVEEPPAPAPEPAAEVVAEPRDETPPAERFDSEDTDLEVKDEDAENESETYFPNQFTMEVGLLPNSKVPGPTNKFGGGLRYARALNETFTAEGGFFYYKSTEEEVSSTIIPILGTIRMQKRFTPLWTGYLYGGFIYPYVASHIGLTKKQLSQIQAVSPAIGAGLFLQTGPNWYLRLNLGLEAMTFGVMLRY